MISCDCSCDDFEGPSVCSTLYRRARKPHRCCECGDEIPVGARYEYASGCWDGSWSDFKTCMTCVAIRENYCPSGWVYGGLAEQILGCLGFDYRRPEDGDDHSLRMGA